MPQNERRDVHDGLPLVEEALKQVGGDDGVRNDDHLSPCLIHTRSRRRMASPSLLVRRNGQKICLYVPLRRPTPPRPRPPERIGVDIRDRTVRCFSTHSHLRRHLRASEVHPVQHCRRCVITRR